MKKVVLCGGDKREIAVMNALREKGYRVLVYGYPVALVPEGIEVVADIRTAFQEADVCILPQPPIKKDGELHSLCQDTLYLSVEDFSFLSPKVPILCGVASPFLRYCAENNPIYELAEDDRMAIPLAPASAEGTLVEAITVSGGLLCGSKALILGFGRIGKELAWRLEGIGMEVVVLNRGSERALEAAELGYTVVGRNQLVEAALEADYIFNTVPAPLLDALVIGLLHRETCIVDLAAYPGGTDFAAAAKRGLRAIHTGGLPGKYTAEYAGMIMAEFYPSFLEELFSREVQNG